MVQKVGWGILNASEETPRAQESCDLSCFKPWNSSCNVFSCFTNCSRDEWVYFHLLLLFVYIPLLKSMIINVLLACHHSMWFFCHLQLDLIIVCFTHVISFIPQSRNYLMFWRQFATAEDFSLVHLLASFHQLPTSVDLKDIKDYSRNLFSIISFLRIP